MLGAGLKHHIGAIDLVAVLGVNNHGAKLPAKSPPRLRRAQDLDAKIYDAETCKLGVTNDNAELRVHILKIILQGHIYEISLKKELQNKKIRSGRVLSLHLYCTRTPAVLLAQVA